MVDFLPTLLSPQFARFGQSNQLITIFFQDSILFYLQESKPKSFASSSKCLTTNLTLQFMLTKKSSSSEQIQINGLISMLSSAFSNIFVFTFSWLLEVLCIFCVLVFFRFSIRCSAQIDKRSYRFASETKALVQ